jgi:predicted Zn-dependent protease
MDVYAQIVESIIRHQEAIIGPVAVEQAEHVQGLQVDWAQHQVTVSGDPVSVIDNLVQAYKNLFGQISVEVSKEAAGSLLGRLEVDKLPQTLK